MAIHLAFYFHINVTQAIASSLIWLIDERFYFTKLRSDRFRIKSRKLKYEKNEKLLHFVTFYHYNIMLYFIFQ